MSSVPEDPSLFNAESATSLAADFLRRLGYSRGLLPKKVSLDGETYVVEIGVEKRTAKVQIDSKTKLIREYEIQEAEEAPARSSRSIPKPILLILIVVPVAVAALKLMGIF